MTTPTSKHGWQQQQQQHTKKQQQQQQQQIITKKLDLQTTTMNENVAWKLTTEFGPR